MNEHEAMKAEFLKGALRVQGMVSGSDQRAFADASGQNNQFLIAVLDTSNHPLMNITDLARLYEQEDRQSLTRVLWTYVIDDPGGNLVKLTCTYQEPVALEFSVIFECNTHWTFLRQVAENGVIDIADNPPQSGQEVEEHRHLHIVLSGELVDDLTLFLRATRVGGIQKQKGKKVTDIETMLAALDAKRFMSMDEVKMIASSINAEEAGLVIDRHVIDPVCRCLKPFLQSFCERPGAYALSLRDSIPLFIPTVYAMRSLPFKWPVLVVLCSTRLRRARHK
jgi:hypothetical protein